MNNLDNTRSMKTIAFFFWVIFTLQLLYQDPVLCDYSDKKIIQQYNERIVISNFRSDEVKDGITILSKSNKGVIVIGDKSGFLINYAAKEIKKYIKISMGVDLEVKKDVEVIKDDYKNHLILLGKASNNSLIKKLNIKLDKHNLEDDGIFIEAVKEPFGEKSNTLIIAGKEGKGVLNGAYTFLNKAINIEWFPPRIHRNYMEYFVNNHIYDAGYYRVRDENRFQIETYIENREVIKWDIGELVENPVVKELGMIYDKLQFRKALIDWNVKNKLNTIVVYVDIHFPLHIDEANRLKEVVKYAHKFGVKVHFFTFTHIASKESRSKYPEIHVIQKKSYKDKDEGTYVVDNPRTLEESSKLMVNLIQEYGIDGIGWHPSSERIDKTVEDGKPEYYWETVYINAYFKAIKEVKPDAKMFFVLGWEYMNPPEELISYIPEEVVAWIVPSRAWTRQYIEGYVENFLNIWFWLYPWFSKEGVFPYYYIDRLQKYVKEAASRKILGIIPEMYGIRNHEMNLIWLAKLYWNPNLDAEIFKNDFNDKYYYYDSRGNLGVQSYMEGDFWGAYELFRDAYNECNNPMVRDRLKDMAISSLCFIEDAAADPQRMYKICKEAEEIFIEHYISNEETDLFYIILKELTDKWEKRITKENGSTR